MLCSSQPAAQQPAGRLGARVQRDEGEAAAHRGVDQGDRAVGGVHRADDEEVLRQRERPSSSEEYIRSIDLVAVLQQEVQLAEDLRQVGAVDLVDDQDVRLAGVLARLVDELAQRSGL